MQALSIASAGMTAAIERLDASAQRTARWGQDPDVDLAREAVEQVSAKIAFKANAAVVRTADDMMGYLFDILA